MVNATALNSMGANFYVLRTHAYKLIHIHTRNMLFLTDQYKSMQILCINKI